MTLAKDDKKEISLIICEALEQLVLPRLQSLENKVDKGFKKVDERFEEVDERFNDIDMSMNRIETLAKSEIKYVDNLSARVIKLETKKV